MADNENGETQTVESLNATIERLNADVAEAQTAQQNATDAMDKNRKVPIDELLVLAQNVKDAESSVSKAEAQVKTAQNALARLEYDSKTVVLREATETVVSAVRDAVTAIADILHQFNVTGLNVDASGLDTETPVWKVRPVGPDIPKAPSRAGTGAGRGGARGRVLFQTPSGALGSREMLEQFGQNSKSAERVSKMLALPNAGSMGLSHLARQVGIELGYDVTVTEPSAKSDS